MEELIHELMHMGLSEKEAAVYLASLELGPAVVQDIAKKSAVNRATTYVMIESLGARGLMSSYVKGKKRYFSSEAPDRLLSIVHLQQKELTEKETEIRAAMPRLQALYNAEGERPQIRYIEGTEGIRTVQEIFQNLSGEFVEIVSVEDVAQIEDLIEKRDEHVRELERVGTTYRLLAVMKTPDFSKIPAMRGGEIRIVPSDKFPIHGDISVRQHTVYMYSFKTALVGVIVQNKELADTVKVMFELAWNGAKEYPSKKIE